MQVMDHTGCISRFLGIGFIPIFIKEPEVKIKRAPKVTQEPRVKRKYKKRVITTIRVLDADVARIRQSIRSHLESGNIDEIPRETYHLLLNKRQLTYTSGNIMSYDAFYNHSRIVREIMGLPLDVQKIRADKIVNLFDQGKNVKEISILTDSDESQVRKVLTRNKRKFRSDDYVESRQDIFVREFKQGKSIKDIERISGSKSKYIRSVLIKFNLIKKQ